MVVHSGSSRLLRFRVAVRSHGPVMIFKKNLFCFSSFLSRVSILTRDIDIANLSVCLFVRPSVNHIVIVFQHTVAKSFCF